MIFVFDLSGVFFNNGLKIAVAKVSKEFSLNQQLVEFVLDGSFARDYRSGIISSSAYWKKVKSRLKVDDVDRVRSIFFKSYRPNKQVAILIKKLHLKGFKVAYLSNGPRDRSEFLEKNFRFLHLFDFGLFAYEAGSWKPEKKIYLTFLKKFKIDAKEVVFIDERERNIQAAKGVGMKAILFKDVKQLLEVLKSFRIEF